MTRNTFKNILLAVAALLAFNSCLEKKPGDYLPLEEGMNSVTAAEEIVNGIYKTLMSGSLYSACIPLCPDIQADLVHAVKGNSNTYVKIWQWDIQAGDANVEAVYSGLYRVIGQCNYFLENVDALKDRLTDDGQILQLDALTGETYFCRALAYSELIKFFCKAYEPDSAADELGVVLALAYSGEKPSRRSDLKSSYGQVLSDLAAADALLDPDYDVANSIYVRNAAVHALWARTALYMQDWDEAVNHSSRVIESGVYSLADANSRYSSDQTFLEYLWSGDASYEIIFKLGYTSTSYGAATGSVFLNFTRDYYYYYPDFVPSQAALNTYQAADCRYDCYFRELQTGYSHQLKWPLLVKYFGNGSLLDLNIYHVNMPKLFRLAEQYLIRAEAYCRRGEYSKASADLTTLRKSRFSSGGAIAVDADNFLDVLSAERVRELYMEGFRLQDLKRWHKGFGRTPQASCVSEGGSLKIEPDDKRFVWPIPRNEIEAPGSEIQPNESN